MMEILLAHSLIRSRSIMKKNLFTLGLIAVAALTLATNCAKTEDDAPIKEDVKEEVTAKDRTFSLVASSFVDGETKTTNDGMHTVWAETDELSVFHAETTTSTYVCDEDFTTNSTDMASGLFKGTLGTDLASGKSYDWYVIYPYKSTLATLNNEGNTYYYFGGPTNVAQVQDGNSNKDHLAGDKYLLFGKATGVAYNAVPDVELVNLSSIIEVQVSNKSTAPFTVEDVSFTAPEGVKIVGQFIPDFTADPITYSNGSYVSEVANLSVTGATPIAVDGVATFYLGIKPFSATSGQTIKVSVNGHEKTITLPKDMSFQAGKIKTINFNYTFEDVYSLVTAVEAFSDGGKYVFALQDGVSASTYYFLNNAGGSDNLDTDLTVSTNTITNPIKKYVFTAEAASTLFKFVNSNGKYIYNNNSNTTANTNNDVAASWAVIAIDGGYFKLSVNSSTGRYLAANAANPTKVAAYTNSNWSSNKGNQHAATANAIAQYSGAWSVFKLGGYTPPAGISNETVNDIVARGASGLTKTVTLTNYAAAPSLTATPDGAIVTSASVTSVSTTSATITYTVAPNYTGAAAEGSITVEDTESHSGTITVNQVADVFSVSRTSIELNANSGATATLTVNSDFDWTIDDSGLSGFTVSPNNFTYTSTRSQIVTITATGSNATASPVDLDIFCVTRTADNKDSDDITVSQKSAKLATPVLTITPDAANKKFTVSWADVTNASKYEYYVLDKDLNDKIATTQTADASTKSFEVTSINLGEDYHVSVKAIGDGSPWIDSSEAEETVNVAAGSKSETISGTFTFADSKLSLTTASGITIVQEKVSGSNAVNSDYKTATALRVYVGHSLTFSGKTITKIEFTHSSSYKGSDGISANVGTYSQGSSSSTWTGESTNVVITNSGGSTTRQLRPTQIVVYYK